MSPEEAPAFRRGERVTVIEIDAWFSPRHEYIETDKTIAVVTYCRLCNLEIFRRTYGKMPEKPTVTETAQAEAIRHQDAQVDGRAFFQHLETQHPEKYEFGDVIPQQDN